MNYTIIQGEISPTTKKPIEYKKLENGTCYNAETPDEMIEILEKLRENRTRCRFHWGDIKTGIDWEDDFDVKGRISRSTGPIKIPILIYNERSIGGGGMLTHCIVKITTTKGNKLIYQHPNYHIEADLIR